MSQQAELIRVLVVGDPYFPVADFEPWLADLGPRVRVDSVQIESTSASPPRTDSERTLREYAGDPSMVAAAVADHQVLVVHGAPVSAETLACPQLRLVSCVRGGPVNVDLAAATERGIPVCTAPGKNAAAVAELAIAFILMNLRGIASSAAEFRQVGRLGSVFDGRDYFGSEAASTTVGLVGLGRVGTELARRALALGFRVVAHDPYVSQPIAEVEMVSLEDLLARSQVVSLHARGTSDGKPIMSDAQFEAMQPGAYFINTAREQLVDEAALGRALASGRIAAAAMDVIEAGPPGTRNPLLDRPNVIVTPHIGGATYETLRRGAQMAAEAISAYRDGRPLPYLANPAYLENASNSETTVRQDVTP